MFQFTAGSAESGQRLDKFLAVRLPEMSRARVQALIRDGAVRVNGRTVKASYEVTTGDAISGKVPPDKPAEAAPQALPLDVLFEDAHLAVLNKASGMVVHPAHGHDDGTVVNALLHRFGGLSSIGGVTRPGIVHRLDRETSGCLVVARNDAVHRSLTEQFAGRSVEKVYLAVCQGVPAIHRGTIQNRIGRNPRDRQTMAVVRPPAGREAVTDYEVRHVTAGDALVVCTLHTGRTHQIRVHFKSLGHPLLGDDTYARPARQTPAPRLMLHAWRLGITHPVSGERIKFIAPVPVEFNPWLPTDAEFH